MNYEERNERMHVTPFNPDQRTHAQRDRDRIIYSSSLRRLASVTQVVDPAEGHIFHNRLTHTIEVCQIARRIAEKFVEKYKNQEEKIESIGGIDPEVVEAAALLHDLGHPPFGHISEHVLDSLVGKKKYGIVDGYEGNAQSFRIATHLDLRYDGVPGLNLTRATLNAMLKYPWFRDPQAIGKKNRKWGAYQIDREAFEWARQPFGNSQFRTVEAEIMDWADDIAFSVHDLEDFYRAGLIPLERLTQGDQAEQQKCLDGIYRKWKDKPRPEEDETNKREFENIFFEWFDLLLPEFEAYNGSASQRAKVRNFSANMIHLFVKETDLRFTRNEKGGFLEIHPNMVMLSKVFKEVNRHYVIDSPAVATQQYGKAQVVKKLFGIFMKCMESGKIWASVLPPYHRERVEMQKAKNGGELSDADRVRLVADIVSGLTDNEALVLYGRLTGLQPGSIMDMQML